MIERDPAASIENHLSHPLIIRVMDSSDQQRWNQFVFAHPSATFFHRAEWKTIIEKAFGHRTWFLYAESNGEIQGILPLAEVKSLLFGHSLSALPFCVYGGIVASSYLAREKLETAALELAEELKVDQLEYRNIDSVHTDWPHKDLYVTFRKTIDPDPEKNMLTIPRKQRAMVRKGINNHLLSEIDSTIDRFFFAYSRSVHRLGTPVFSKHYFQLLKETFADDCEVLTITKDGRTISSVMNFYFRDEVLPYYGGGTDEARQFAANDFMYWELMRISCERGIGVFDFGRSKRDSGSYSFKKNWGFEAQPLHYEYQLINSIKVPDHNPANPKYQIFIKAWRKLPLPLANIIGPHIVKYLG